MLRLALSGRQHRQSFEHLFPGDGKEAALVALCGVGQFGDRTKLLVHEVHPVPYEVCTERREDCVSWPAAWLDPLLDQAELRGWSILKVHSHPSGYESFSAVDDRSDRDLFHGIHSWLDTEGPHFSAVMLPDGRMFARSVAVDGTFAPVDIVSVAGDDIHMWHHKPPQAQDSVLQIGREAGTFGRKMVAELGRLSVGVVGCSGTGSVVIEQLARLGLGRIVLVDPDIVEVHNLNRIVNANADDAKEHRFKVHVARDAIHRLQFGTIVEALAENVVNRAAVKALGSCDLLFGCVDSAEGRDVLNKIAAAYLVPYIDVGVGLVADNSGAIDQVDAAIHYLQPEASSLLSREAYRPGQVQAEARRRSDPEAFAALRRAGYIQGVEEQQPAVIPINMAAASFAVLEMLSRLYGYRHVENAAFATVRLNLAEVEIEALSEGEICPFLARLVGIGDSEPLLRMPELTMKSAQ
jgi:hypothetical protein